MRALRRSHAATAVASLVSERQLLQQVRDLAVLARGLVYHTHDSRRSEPGFPDVVLLVPSKGKAWVLELKQQTGRVSTEQAEWLAAFRACGFDARVVRPADLADLATEVLA